jgi:hypothetical protein
MRRAIILSALWLLAGAASPGVQAQPERRYAVMSLVADSLTVIGQEPQTGTHIRKNTEDKMALGNDGLDQFTMQAVLAALEKAAPGVPAVAVRAGSPQLYDRQASFIDGTRANLPADVLAALRDAKVTHLVLVSKYRAEAKMQAAEIVLGSGVVQGLGFYIDRYRRMRASESGEQGVGFLAPYAYFQLSLIDLENSTVLRNERVTKSHVIGNTRGSQSQGAEPWDLLDSAGKMDALGGMLTSGVAQAVPRLVAAP